MTTKNIIELIAMITGILLSAFFSSSETAITSINKFKLRQLEEKEVKNASLLKKLVEDSQNTITTILVGNNIVNILTTTIATLFFTDIFGAAGAAISTVIVTITVLIFGEITPKMEAQINSEKIALRFARTIYFISLILKPLVFLLGIFTKYLTKIMSDEGVDKNQVTEEDLKTIVDVGEEQGVLNNEESEIINNVFDFGQSFASDIMTPRTNMETISIDSSKKELDEFLIECKHSRIPVYGESIDNIVGVLHMKDIVTFIAEGRDPKLKDMLRQTYYAYENMNIIDLFKSMKKMNVSLAIVVDEYGGTEGLVSIEDIVEELVGDIYDEYDLNNEKIYKVSDNEFIIEASMHINDFNDYFNKNLQEVKNDSIGGLVIDYLNRLPKAGDLVKVSGITLICEKVERYKIDLVRVRFNEN
ncbi:hemolysin family protein [Anaerococcus faecalis]|nr:hemolysin family protein [Anaerococcus faecalis]